MSKRDDNEATDSVAVPMVHLSEDEKRERDTTYPSENVEKLISAEAMINSRVEGPWEMECRSS